MLFPVHSCEEKCKLVNHLCCTVLAEFILEMSYPYRRIIRQTDNSSKYRSEDEFCSIIRLDILRGLHDGWFGVEEPSCENIETVPLMWKFHKKPSPFRLDVNLETDNPSVSTSSRRKTDESA